MAITNMGIGSLGEETAVFKRRFRWIFSISDLGNSGPRTNSIVKYATVNSPGHICKIASRPTMTFNEQEVQHVIETVYLPTKPKWNPINITVYDLKGDDYLYQWMKTFYNPEEGFVNPCTENTAFVVNRPTGIGSPKKIGVLRLLDGHGNLLEAWELQGCWPLEINWGNLDFNSDETLDIEFQLRYDRAVLFNQFPNGGTGFIFFQ